MARTVIEIEGETSDAVEALDDATKAATDLKQAVDALDHEAAGAADALNDVGDNAKAAGHQAQKAAGDVRTLGSTMRFGLAEAGKLAAGFISMQLAMEAFRTGSALLKFVLDEYVAGSDSARRSTDALRENVRRLATQFGEATLGGGVLEDVVGALSAVFVEAGENVDENATAMQAWTKGAVADAIDAVGSLARAGTFVTNVVRSFGMALRVVEPLLFGIEASTRLVGGVMIDFLAQPIRVVTESLSVLLDGVALASRALGAEGLAVDLTNTRRVVDAMGEDLDALGNDIRAGIPDALGRARDSLVAMPGDLADTANAMLEAQTSADAFARSVEEQAQRLRDGVSAVGELHVALERLPSSTATVIDGQADAVGTLATEVDGLMVGLRGIDEILAEGQEAVLAQKKAVLAEIMGMQAKAGGETSKIMEFEEEALASASKAWDSYAKSTADAVADVATGQKSMQEASKAIIASVLDAEANAALAKAGLMFASGNIVGGAALTGAALLAKVAARAISSAGTSSNGSTPASRGSAPVAAAAPVSTTNIQLVNNFGVGTDRRAISREIADGVRDARRYGYLGV